ncbi:MAG: sigma-70 family RNA polymerase sigma factor, partial [Candidatus Atribacteria bacterium]|nr:sigma-70 family RNA polymerase sigma factor [Candidatus Atribacteria bacterium]
KYRYSYNDQYPFQNWVYAILLNIHRHNCKKEKLFKTFIPWKNPDNDEEQDAWDFIESEDEGPEEKALKKQLMIDIEKSIRSLPLKMREVIALCDMMGYSYEEASEIVHCPLGTIRSRLHRARRQVKKDLEKTYGEELLSSWR